MPVVEVWIPDERGVFLQRAAGSYIGHEAFGDKSSGAVFGKGDGLPGRCWASKQPEVFQSLPPPSHFVRSAAAAESGLAAGIAIPVMREGEVTAVVVFLTPDPTDSTALMEIWSPTFDGTALSWRYGYYGALKDVQDASIRTRFEPGQGLPGRAWQDRRPEIVPDLSTSSDAFTRPEITKTAGLTHGLSLPVILGTTMQSIVTLLSARDIEFASAVEIWRPTEDGSVLQRHDGHYGAVGDFRGADPSIQPGQGLAGRVWEDGLPHLVDSIDGAPQLQRGLGIPMIDDEKVTAVVLMMS